MRRISRLLSSLSLALLALAASALTPKLAQAQTWVGNRQGPALTEILTIDATGEPNWPWGSEDVAGNGLNNFPAAEQAIDARSVYVATDATRFFTRVYFSVPDAEPGTVTTFVFIDSDQNPATGGRASAVELDPAFTSDPTNGGYEYVIEVQRTANNTTTGSIWQFYNASQIFTVIAAQPNQLLTESNVYLDPLRVDQNVHGYVQSSVELALVGLTPACGANIFVRTTNQTQNLGAGDLVVGAAESCVPVVNNNNNVPVVIIPPPGCTDNTQCPNAGVCINGNCILARPCAVDANCLAGDTCTLGRCVARGGYACTNSSNCDGLLCEQGRCVICVNDAACGPGFFCGSDGRCAAGNGTIPCANSSTCDGLTCQQGRCVICANDAACGPGFFCGADGRCAAGNGTPCANSSTCNGLVCQRGQCAICANDAACGPGFVCGTDGRCLATGNALPSDAGQIYLQPGERLQGGACACRAGTGRGPGLLGLFSLLGLALLMGRNSKREREG